MIKGVTLHDWCARYALRRGLAGESAYVIARTVHIFGEWLGRSPYVSDLDDDAASRWVEWLESHYAPRTRAGLRGNLLCLWRFIAEQGECDWPGRIRRAPKPEPQPVAWTMEELRLLRLATLAVPGNLKSGVPRSLYLTTLLDSAYESGLRRGDLWRLTQQQILPSGIILLRQNKTGTPHEPQLQPDTLERVRRLVGEYPLRWPGNEHGFYECWRIWVLRPSGVRPGVLQQLRRSGATHIERERPAETSRYLGHKTPTMKIHYVDRSQAYGPAPQPPKFWW